MSALPVWAQVVLTIAALGGAYLAFVRKHDASVWEHIAALQKLINDQSTKLDTQMARIDDLEQQLLESHEDRGRMHDSIEQLQNEVNELLGQLGQPPRYPKRTTPTTGL